MELDQMQTQYEKQLEVVHEDQSRTLKDKEQQRQDEITKLRDSQQHIIRSLTDQNTKTLARLRAAHTTELGQLKEQQTKQESKLNAKIEQLETELHETVHTLDEEREQHDSLKVSQRLDEETWKQTQDRLQTETTMREQVRSLHNIKPTVTLATSIRTQTTRRESEIRTCKNQRKTRTRTRTSSQCV